MAKHLNLLPPARRARLRRGTFLLASIRLTRFIVLSLGVFSIGGGLLIVGMWLLTITFTTPDNKELEKKVTEYVTLKQEILAKNELLRLVKSLAENRVVWSTYLAEFLHTIPPGTAIHSLTGDARVGIIEFSGNAPTRNTLVVFEERISQLSWVQNIAAPRRNFIHKENPDYTFEIHLKGYENNFETNK